MKKLLLAAATAGTMGLAALASAGSAEAKGFGFKGHGFHGGGFHHGHSFHHGHGFGHRHYGFRSYGWGYGVRTVGVYSGGSCWRYRWTPYGYKYVNVCVRPLYY